MSELTMQLLKLVNEGKTINEIAEILNISHKRLYNIFSLIRNKGYEFDKKYYYTGDTIYVPKKRVLTDEQKGVDIITSPNDQEFEALVISDLHIGSIKQRPDLLERVYDYCVKEGIHIIIACGDIIDGTFGRSEKIYDNVSEQIDYLLKIYPFDKNILNFVLLGDHDYSALNNTGQNIAKVLESYRHDMISLGYRFGQINIKNDCILVKHKGEYDEQFRAITPKHYFLSLYGHFHNMRYKTSPNCATITVPPLCDILYPDCIQFASLVRMKLQFNHGFINKGNFKQLAFKDNIEILSEFECYLGYDKDNSGNNPVRLEEKSPKKRVLKPSNPIESSS